MAWHQVEYNGSYRQRAELFPSEHENVITLSLRLDEFPMDLERSML